MTHHLPLFTTFLRVGATLRVPGCAVGTILRYHNFVVVPEITTRVYVTLFKHLRFKMSVFTRYFLKNILNFEKTFV